MPFGEESPGGGKLPPAQVGHGAHAGVVDQHGELVRSRLDDVKPVVAVQVTERDGFGPRPDSWLV